MNYKVWQKKKKYALKIMQIKKVQVNSLKVEAKLRFRHTPNTSSLELVVKSNDNLIKSDRRMTGQIRHYQIVSTIPNNDLALNVKNEPRDII